MMAFTSEHRGGLKSSSLWSPQICPLSYVESFGDPYDNTFRVWSPSWMSPWCPTCHAYNHPMEVRDIFADYRRLLTSVGGAWKTPLTTAPQSSLLANAPGITEPSPILESSKISPSNVRTKQRRMQRLQKREMGRAMKGGQRIKNFQ